MQITNEEGLKQLPVTRSALGAMLTPQKVHHVPTRLVFSGKTVTGKKDLPALPDASAREAVKEEIARLAYRKKLESNRKSAWRKKNEEPWECRQRFEQWKKDNPEKYKQAQKDYRDKNPDAYKEYRKKWRDKNKERIAQYNREYSERKRNAEKERASEIGTGNPSPQELGSTAKRGAIPGARTAKTGICATENATTGVPTSSL